LKYLNLNAFFIFPDSRLQSPASLGVLRGECGPAPRLSRPALRALRNVRHLPGARRRPRLHGHGGGSQVSWEIAQSLQIQLMSPLTGFVANSFWIRTMPSHLDGAAGRGQLSRWLLGCPLPTNCHLMPPGRHLSVGGFWARRSSTTRPRTRTTTRWATTLTGSHWRDGIYTVLEGGGDGWPPTPKRVLHRLRFMWAAFQPHVALLGNSSCDLSFKYF